jgi:hypothetical protein
MDAFFDQLCHRMTNSANDIVFFKNINYKENKTNIRGGMLFGV